MANNTIQIKRSVANGTVTGLANGELAFTQASNTLWIGLPDGSATVPIGGIRTPGTLAANQSLVTNSTSAINQIIVGQAVFTGTGQTINVGGSVGTAGYVLSSNGSSNLVWVSPSSFSTSASGANTQIQYNNSGSFGASSGFVFNYTSNNLTVGNTVIASNLNIGTIGAASNGVVATANVIQIGNNSVYTNVTPGSVIAVGGTFTGNGYNLTSLNATAITTGTLPWSQAPTGTANLSASQSFTGNNTFQGTNTVFSSNVTVSGNAYFTGSNVFVTGTVNATSYNTGAPGTGTGGIVINSTTVSVGNATQNSTITASGLVVNGTSVIANNSGVYTTGTVNAAAFTTTGNANAANFYAGANTVLNATNLVWTGNATLSPTVTLANTGSFTIGNSTTTQTTSIISIANSSGNVQITPTGITGNGYNLTSVNAAALGGYTFAAPPILGSTTANGASLTYANVSGQVNTSTFYASTSANVGTYFTVNSTSANTTIPTNLASGSLIANSVAVTTSSLVNTNIAAGSLTANATAVNTSVNATLGGTTLTVAANATFNANLTTSGALTTLGGTNTNITSNVNITGTAISLTGTSITGTTSDVSFRNGTFAGNLTISGTVTTINTSQMVVNDNIIELGYNNGVVATDLIDSGWFTPANTSSTLNFPGFGRIATLSTATNPYFKIFTSTTNPNASLTFTTTSTGTLESYLAPYGTGGAFIANSTVVNITANSTVSSTLTVNSVTLTTALAVGSGGTGSSTYTAGDILYSLSGGSTLTKLSVPGSAANGQVLQITNNLPAYGTLDAGTF